MLNKGSCQCNAIRYEFHGAPFNCCYCYCSICRKLTGSAMGSYGTVEKERFRWVEGEGLLGVYEQNKSLKRMFCSQCGSFIAGTHKLDPANIFISLGCLESDEQVEIEYQQFVNSKANWVQLDETIQMHKEWPAWVYEKVGKKGA